MPLLDNLPPEANDSVNPKVLHRRVEITVEREVVSVEYLPANLERGVFLIPSRPLREPVPAIGPYGYGHHVPRCTGHRESVEPAPFGIGIGLI